VFAFTFESLDCCKLETMPNQRDFPLHNEILNLSGDFVCPSNMSPCDVFLQEPPCLKVTHCGRCKMKLFPQSLYSTCFVSPAFTNDLITCQTVIYLLRAIKSLQHPECLS